MVSQFYCRNEVNTSFYKTCFLLTKKVSVVGQLVVENYMWPCPQSFLVTSSSAVVELVTNTDHNSLKVHQLMISILHIINIIYEAEKMYFIF